MKIVLLLTITLAVLALTTAQEDKKKNLSRSKSKAGQKSTKNEETNGKNDSVVDKIIKSIDITEINPVDLAGKILQMEGEDQTIMLNFINKITKKSKNKDVKQFYDTVKKAVANIESFSTVDPVFGGLVRKSQGSALHNAGSFMKGVNRGYNDLYDGLEFAHGSVKDATKIFNGVPFLGDAKQMLEGVVDDGLKTHRYVNEKISGDAAETLKTAGRAMRKKGNTMLEESKSKKQRKVKKEKKGEEEEEE